MVILTIFVVTILGLFTGIGLVTERDGVAKLAGFMTLLITAVLLYSCVKVTYWVVWEGVPVEQAMTRKVL